MEAFVIVLILSMLFCLPCYSTIHRLIQLPFKLPTKDRREKRKLPPGPPALISLVMLPFLSLKRASDLNSIIGKLRRRYGPIVTVYLDPSSPTIIVTGRELIREALVEKGATFAARPSRGIEPGPIPIVAAISAATYGSTWRLLRQTLASGIFHPSYVRSLTSARQWALGIVKEKLECKSRLGNGIVEVRDALQCAMLSLLGLLCYGKKLEDDLIDDIKVAHNQIASIYDELSFDFLAMLGDFFFGTRSRALQDIRRKHEEVFVPLIRARRAHKNQQLHQKELPHQQPQEYVHDTTVNSYVDSLLDLRLPEEKNRELDDTEIMVACYELLGSAAAQVPTIVEWTIANLVKNPCTQEKLQEEIQRVMQEEGSAGSSELKEESLEKMEYLNAVVLESLRMHPPAHLLLTHSVLTEVSLGGYVIPKDANVLFMAGEVGYDESVWSKPSEFRPERFLPGGEGERVDLTGRRELKMMPFSLGRRTCPSTSFSIPLVKYLVANMVKEFKWESAHGDDVDMLDKFGLVVTMHTPLQVRISPRVLSV
uniref:Cytochrome P450 89A2 n=1 Tax=Anthurium amnicola TaxID=1678845 RepID=A0A1D1XLP2_9ARAE